MIDEQENIVNRLIISKEKICEMVKMYNNVLYTKEILYNLLETNILEEYIELGGTKTIESIIINFSKEKFEYVKSFFNDFLNYINNDERIYNILIRILSKISIFFISSNITILNNIWSFTQFKKSLKHITYCNTGKEYELYGLLPNTKDVNMLMILYDGTMHNILVDYIYNIINVNIQLYKLKKIHLLSGGKYLGFICQIIYKIYSMYSIYDICMNINDEFYKKLYISLLQITQLCINQQFIIKKLINKIIIIYTNYINYELNDILKLDKFEIINDMYIIIDTYKIYYKKNLLKIIKKVMNDENNNGLLRLKSLYMYMKIHKIDECEINLYEHILNIISEVNIIKLNNEIQEYNFTEFNNFMYALSFVLIKNNKKINKKNNSIKQGLYNMLSYISENILDQFINALSNSTNNYQEIYEKIQIYLDTCYYIFDAYINIIGGMNYYILDEKLITSIELIYDKLIKSELILKINKLEIKDALLTIIINRSLTIKDETKKINLKVLYNYIKNDIKNYKGSQESLDTYDEKYYDPILHKLIIDPIMIPLIDEIFDRSTIYLLMYESKFTNNKSIHPYTREELTFDELIEYNKKDDIVKKIKEFKTNCPYFQYQK